MLCWIPFSRLTIWIAQKLQDQKQPWAFIISTVRKVGTEKKDGKNENAKKQAKKNKNMWKSGKEAFVRF